MKQLSKNLKCIRMRSSVEIWVEDDRIQELKKIINGIKTSKFIDIGDDWINTADIEGIYSPKTMEDFTKRKNGQWLCKYGIYHNRYEKCNCYELKKYKIRYLQVKK